MHTISIQINNVSQLHEKVVLFNKLIGSEENEEVVINFIGKINDVYKEVSIFRYEQSNKFPWIVEDNDSTVIKTMSGEVTFFDYFEE